MKQPTVIMLIAMIVGLSSASFAQELKLNPRSIDTLTMTKPLVNPAQFKFSFLVMAEFQRPFQGYKTARLPEGDKPFEVRGLQAPLWPSNPFSIEFAIAKGYYKKQPFPRRDCWP